MISTNILNNINNSYCIDETSMLIMENLQMEFQVLDIITEGASIADKLKMIGEKIKKLFDKLINFIKTKILKIKPYEENNYREEEREDIKQRMNKFDKTEGNKDYDWLRSKAGQIKIQWINIGYFNNATKLQFLMKYNYNFKGDNYQELLSSFDYALVDCFKDYLISLYEIKNVNVSTLNNIREYNIADILMDNNFSKSFEYKSDIENKLKHTTNRYMGALKKLQESLEKSKKELDRQINDSINSLKYNGKDDPDRGREEQILKMYQTMSSGKLIVFNKLIEILNQVYTHDKREYNRYMEEYAKLEQQQEEAKQKERDIETDKDREFREKWEKKRKEYGFDD